MEEYVAGTIHLWLPWGWIKEKEGKGASCKTAVTDDADVSTDELKGGVKREVF